MVERFPVEYTLDGGTKVKVDKKGSDTYDFLLWSPDKKVDSFTYIDDGRPKAEWDEKLQFEQLEALRTFWLMTEDIL